MKKYVLLSLTLLISTPSVLSMQRFQGDHYDDPYGAPRAYGVARQELYALPRVADKPPMRLIAKDVNAGTSFEEIISALACEVAFANFRDATTLVETFITFTQPHEFHYLTRWFELVQASQKWIALPFLNDVAQPKEDLEPRIDLLGREIYSNQDSIPEIIAQVAAWYAMKNSRAGKRYLETITTGEVWDARAQYAFDWLVELNQAAEAWMNPPRITLEMWGINPGDIRDLVPHPHLGMGPADAANLEPQVIVPVLPPLDARAQQEMSVIKGHYEKDQLGFGNLRLKKLLQSQPAQRESIIVELRRVLPDFTVDDMGGIKKGADMSKSSPVKSGPSSLVPASSPAPVPHASLLVGKAPAASPKGGDQRLLFSLPAGAPRFADLPAAAARPQTRSPEFLREKDEKPIELERKEKKPAPVTTPPLLAPSPAAKAGVKKPTKKSDTAAQRFYPEGGQTQEAGEIMKKFPRKFNPLLAADRTEAEDMIIKRLFISRPSAQILLGSKYFDKGGSLGIVEYPDQEDESDDDDNPDE